MAIKHNPYGWEIRPQKKNIKKELEELYKEIIMDIIKLTQAADRYTIDCVDHNFSMISFRQSQLYDHIQEARALRNELNHLVK